MTNDRQTMNSDPYTWRAIRTGAVIGFVHIAFAGGCQAAFAPTVRVSCPAKASGPPDCEMRWLVAFDQVPIRTIALPGLQSVGEVEETDSRARRSKQTVYLQTAAGRVRTILWAHQMELDLFREPIVKYLQDAQAPPLEVTMWPSTDPQRPGTFHIIRTVANVIVLVGLPWWVWLPVQIAGVFRRRKAALLLAILLASATELRAAPRTVTVDDLMRSSCFIPSRVSL